MPEELATILIDDIDYNYNKVKCRAIEHMMPKLMKMVEGEMEGMRYTRWKTGEEHAYVKLEAKYDKMED